MRIVYALPVRHIEVLEDQTLVAVGIETNMVQATSFPAAIVTPVVAAVAVNHVEARPDVEHPLRIRILNADLVDVIDPVEASLAITPGPQTPPGWEVRSMLRLNLAYVAEQPGTYSIELHADDQTLSIPIVVEGP